ncbi:hypothetical protein J1N35_037338, partial [Gossypium stocksii]
FYRCDDVTFKYYVTLSYDHKLNVDGARKANTDMAACEGVIGFSRLIGSYSMLEVELWVLLKDLRLPGGMDIRESF